MPPRDWHEDCIGRAASAETLAQVREHTEQLIRQGWLTLLPRFGYPFWSVESSGDSPSVAVGRSGSFRAMRRAVVAPQLLVRILAVPREPHVLRRDRASATEDVECFTPGQRLYGRLGHWYRERAPAAAVPWAPLHPVFRLGAGGDPALDWQFGLQAVLWHEDGMLFRMDSARVTSAGLDFDTARPGLVPVYDTGELDRVPTGGGRFG